MFSSYVRCSVQPVRLGGDRLGAMARRPTLDTLGSSLRPVTHGASWRIMDDVEFHLMHEAAGVQGELPPWAEWQRSQPYTVGIEEEVMLLDRYDALLVNCGELVLRELPPALGVAGERRDPRSDVGTRDRASRHGRGRRPRCCDAARRALLGARWPRPRRGECGNASARPLDGDEDFARGSICDCLRIDAGARPPRADVRAARARRRR